MIKIHLCGDIMIGRSFNETFKYYPQHNIWGDTLSLLQKSDFVLGNLETTITSSNNKWPNKAFNYKLDPKYKSVLTTANISHLNIANNHILDYNVEGMIDTMNNLNDLNITYTGAGSNLNEASKPIIKNIKGIKIGILSYSDHYDYWKATKKGYGINYIDLDKDYGHVLEHIRKTKELCDILILSIHHGSNYVVNIQDNTKKFFHNALSSGVDIVHGHSAHHILPIEVVDGKYIFYSIGDFIDDYAVDENFRNDLSFIAELTISNKKIVSLSVYPTKITIDHTNVLIPKVSLINKTDSDYGYVMSQLGLQQKGGVGNEITSILSDIGMLIKRKENIGQLLSMMAPKKYNSITDFILDDNPHKITEEIPYGNRYEHLYLHDVSWVDTFTIKYDWLKNDDGTQITNEQKQIITEYLIKCGDTVVNNSFSIQDNREPYILGDRHANPMFGQEHIENPGLWKLMHNFFRRLPCLMDRLKGIGNGSCPPIEEQLKIEMLTHN